MQRGHIGPSRKVLSPKRTFTSNVGSSNVDHQKVANFQMRPSSSESIASNRHTTQTDNSKYSKENDYEKLSQLALKRTIPISIQPSVPSSRSSNLVDNVSSSLFRNIYGRAGHHAWSNPNQEGEPYERPVWQNSDTEFIVYENNGNRILP